MSSVPENSPSQWRKLPHWVDFVALVLTVLLKVVTRLDFFQRLLPLPKEHELIAWILTIAFIVVGLWIGIQIRSSRVDSRLAYINFWIILSLISGFVFFPMLFWFVEQSWKSLPIVVADPVYKWGVPIVYSCAFGAIAVAFSLILHRIAQWLGMAAIDS